MKLPVFIMAAAALSASSCSNMNDSENTDVEEYLFLELSMGLHDPAQVDAYFGPERLQQQAEAEAITLVEITQRAAALAQSITTWPVAGMAKLELQRIRSLELRLQALQTRVRLNQGAEISFDEESRLLFDAVAPHHDAAYFQEILDQIDALLPGEGPLPDRVSAFRERFIIPPDRLAEVFETALAECRRRTLEHIKRQQSESAFLIPTAAT